MADIAENVNLRIDIKTPFLLVDAIDAELGQVMVRMKDGQVKYFPPREMVEQIKRWGATLSSLTNMADNALRTHRRILIALIDKATEATRKAHFQREDPTTSEEKRLANVYKGLDRLGKPLNAETVPLQDHIEAMVKACPDIEPWQIETILRRTEIPLPARIQLLHQVQAVRQQEKLFGGDADFDRALATPSISQLRGTFDKLAGKRVVLS